MNTEIGSYGVVNHGLLSSFEDDCVGSQPLLTAGIVVSRIDGEKIYVSDWTLKAEFNGEQRLEKFEEAKHNQAFNFSFAGERELKAGDVLDGDDNTLKIQLSKKLLAQKGANSGVEKIRQFMQKSH
ncbi:MAG: hypothetical protein HRU20_09875 [Pseudomonadales bacterium]|nr:hypothetical protein [Pseudomonadales bacterium]